MKEEKLDKLLEQRAAAPMPKLKADPWLATRVAALAEEGHGLSKRGLPWYEWSAATVVTMLAVVAGLYLGAALQTDTTQNDDVWQSYSEALMPETVGDSFYALQQQLEGEQQ